MVTQFIVAYYSDIIMSAIVSWLFAQLFVQVQVKENIKTLCH